MPTNSNNIKSMDTKKFYIIPSIEEIEIERNDIIATSGEQGGSDTPSPTDDVCIRFDLDNIEDEGFGD